ncbi:hypothetical protein SAMN02745962_01388 [Pseudomonas sp. LAIL14HWK12:I11]|nr:hypothetical protein SAMN02745962_01388 [Pseudomonas sp. LAIL14HWK12:I11]SMR72729.1 hypothetical protein SAMN05661028_01389 [Pseudomonas sp. LAIL14HWK12:I10]SOD01615.1 hypothetical protein SAMN05660296_01389 [Pseudomonas sp. LAIL14HWK12:I8]
MMGAILAISKTASTP